MLSIVLSLVALTGTVQEPSDFQLERKQGDTIVDLGGWGGVLMPSAVQGKVCLMGRTLKVIKTDTGEILQEFQAKGYWLLRDDKPVKIADDERIMEVLGEEGHDGFLIALDQTGATIMDSFKIVRLKPSGERDRLRYDLKDGHWPVGYIDGKFIIRRHRAPNVTFELIGRGSVESRRALWKFDKNPVQAFHGNISSYSSSSGDILFFAEASPSVRAPLIDFRKSGKDTLSQDTTEMVLVRMDQDGLCTPVRVLAFDAPIEQQYPGFRNITMSGASQVVMFFGSKLVTVNLPDKEGGCGSGTG